MCDGLNVYVKNKIGKNELDWKCKRSKKGIYVDEELKESPGAIGELLDTARKAIEA